MKECRECRRAVTDRGSQSQQLCHTCVGAMRKGPCHYCNCDAYTSKKEGTILCEDCSRYYKAYGEPRECVVCEMKCAFKSDKTCLECRTCLKKYGKCVKCDKCGKERAFPKPSERRAKVGGLFLCFPCTKEFIQSGQAKQPPPPQPPSATQPPQQTQQQQSASDSHSNKRRRTSENPAPAAAPQPAPATTTTTATATATATATNQLISPHLASLLFGQAQPLLQTMMLQQPPQQQQQQQQQQQKEQQKEQGLNDGLRREVDTLRTKLATTLAEVKALSEENKDLKASSEKRRARMEEMAKEIESLKSENKDLKRSLIDLVKKN